MRHAWLFAIAAPLAAQSLALRRPALPDSPAGLHPIDAIVERYWSEQRIRAPEQISAARFARRAYLDTSGLVPTPAELAAFERDGRRERLVDQLLADNRRYAEHWISFWNDVLRNDEGVVYHGERKSITAWLWKGLEDNLPFDRFVQALLNPRAQGDPEGFLIGVNWRGEVPASERPPLQAAQASAQVFLGVNLKCNSCHDSFISKWKLKDAYGLASFFSEQPLELVRCDVPLGETAPAQFLFPELGSVPTGAPLAERRAAAARLFTDPGNGRTPRTIVNRIWKRLMGRGLIEPADDMSARPWNDELLEWLAADFVDHGWDLKHLIRRIMTSRAYAAPAVEHPSKPYVFRGPSLRRLSAEQFADSVSAITGEWRVKQTGTAGVLVREWQAKSTPLARALGRPIRDQVTTERLEEPTTLQALEMVSGATLTDTLARGARRMLGTFADPPANLFDSGTINSQRATIDIDISGASELRLLLEDSDSYDRARIVAGWIDAEFSGPSGTARLEDLRPEAARGTIQLRGAQPAAAVLTPVPGELVVDLRGKDYTRFRASAGVDLSCQISEINPRVRFFVFRAKPDAKQLVRVSGVPPAESGWKTRDRAELTTLLYRHAVARDPLAGERRAAAQVLGSNLAAEALEDLLWAVLLSPEFQYVW